MKVYEKYVITLIFYSMFICGVPVLFGQSTNPQIPGVMDRRLSVEQNQQRDLEKRRAEMRDLGVKVKRKSEPPASVFRQPTKEEKKKKIELITPDAVDLEKYQDFLKQSDTGIFRIYPDFDCETNFLIKVGGECENFVSGIWAYSLRSKEHSNAELQDISYKENSLVSDGFLSQGILVSLNDTSIENLNLKSDGIKYLVDFKPENNRKSIQKQYEDISKGVNHNGFLYANKVKVEENNTYAIRVVAYKYKIKHSDFDINSKGSPDSNKFAMIGFDKRKDLIAVFRVIRKTDNRGLTIVWKELQQIKSPTIFFQKGENISDFKTVDD